MKVGDLVRWTLFLSEGWDESSMQGMIIASRRSPWIPDKGLIIYNVLLTDGTMCEVREDTPTLEEV